MSTGLIFSRSYAELYQSPDTDVFQGNYSACLATFASRPNRERASTASTMATNVLLKAEVQPHAYLTINYYEDDPMVTLIHRIFSFHPPMGAQGESLHFAFVGDVQGGMPPTVVTFPNELFRHTGSIRVPDETTLAAAFAGTTDTTVGPYQDTDAGTAALGTRAGMYLPPKFVSAMLAKDNYTPREAWELLTPLITADGNDPATPSTVAGYQPLLDWLRAACTKSPVANEQGTVQVIIPAALSTSLYTPFPMTGPMKAAVAAVLRRDGLTGSPEPASSTGTIAAINALTERIQEGNAAAEARATNSKLKTPEDYYGQATFRLLRLTHQPSAVTLPELYREVAMTTKRTERSMIEEVFLAKADDLGLPGLHPVVTTSLTKKITTLNFAHHNLDDLDSGIHPFLTVPLAPRDLTLLEQTLKDYDNLVQGSGAQLQDLAALRAAEKAGAPSNLTEATMALKSCRILLHCILGDHHTHTEAFDLFVSAWQRHEMTIARQLELLPHGPTLALRWIQLRMSNWFTTQISVVGAHHPPNYTDLIEKILHHEHWVPQLPIGYLPSPATPRLPSSPGTPSQISPGGPRPPAPAPPAAGSRGERNANQDYKSQFQQFKDMGLSLKTVRDKAKAANKPVPQNATGTEMCLSYHISGFCWSNCSRKEDHRPHSSEESKSLLAWCKECWKQQGPQ